MRRKYVYPGTNCEVRPAAIYTLKHKKWGEKSLTDRFPKAVKEGGFQRLDAQLFDGPPENTAKDGADF